MVGKPEVGQKRASVPRSRLVARVPLRGSTSGSLVIRSPGSKSLRSHSLSGESQRFCSTCRIGVILFVGMKVLIVGAGIAGPAFAYCLNHHGLLPTIVERAPRLRTGGYVVDFWGAGFDMADRMGLLPEIIRKRYRIQEVRVVDRSGRRVAGFPAEVFVRATHGRFISLPRGDLAASIFDKIE